MKQRFTRTIKLVTISGSIKQIIVIGMNGGQQPPQQKKLIYIEINR